MDIPAMIVITAVTSPLRTDGGHQILTKHDQGGWYICGPQENLDTSLLDIF